MIRQRIRLRRLPITHTVVRVLVSLLALALVWYGLMVVLLACKVSPDTVNSLSAYRTVFDQLSGIVADDITGRVRIIVAVAGVLCLVLFAPMAWRALPRPYLTRTTLQLPDRSGPGRTQIAPRAIERAAELAALRHPDVDGAAGRYATHGLDVAVTVTRATELAGTLRSVQERVAAALDTHELPPTEIDVTLAGFER